MKKRAAGIQAGILPDFCIRIGLANQRAAAVDKGLPFLRAHRTDPSEPDSCAVLLPGIGSCLRRRNSSLISRSFACIRSRRYFLQIWKSPPRFLTDQHKAEELEGF